ncbi:MAG: urea ABC transporter permease subunit UrtC [Chloroflexota bacterium]|nr:urea ABC transporter permease subunit UrtC [Chloroflexota bacterium]|tara:strand:+ start:761 stop:1894 length:1134 start_codon:yes stop_codon:yes gene_type:complete
MVSLVLRRFPGGMSGQLSRFGPPIILLLLLLAAPLVLSDFRINLLGKILAFAILALSLDLIWGYAGMLSLGHGVFFGLGGYAFAMFLKLEAAKGELPDFMFWSGLKELPTFWAPFQYAWFAIPMVVILPSLLAGALGFLVFRSRITGVYFALISQALALMVSILFIGQQPYTGGTNGLTNLTSVFGHSLYSVETQKTLYYVTISFLVGSYLLCLGIVSSPFGRLLVAIRDDENRVRFSGYDPAIFKTAVYVVSAALAGIGGALFAPQVGIVSPTMMGIVPSIEVAVWVAVGGRGTLIGAIIGAIVVNYAKSLLSESFPDFWTYFLGALFIGAVLIFPRGIIGLLRREGWQWPRWMSVARRRLTAVGNATASVWGGIK